MAKHLFSNFSGCELFFMFAIICLVCLMGIIYMKKEYQSEIDVDCNCDKKRTT